ncbi:DUF6317 family protein [Actinocorallia populi]|uniref:DUF6317 family protein n=1 Tax=Actinocorallia populi TaxID=2079200 RepID=UPI000D097DD5|nr:DUF6317 family protein [Actinocorallia populi]
MSAEINVVYQDILDSSSVFKTQGVKYDGIVPKEVGTVPQVTESSLSDAITRVLEAISTLHDSLGSSMQIHGDKLKTVHDRYRNTEDDIDDLMRSIDDPATIQPRVGY